MGLKSQQTVNRPAFLCCFISAHCYRTCVHFVLLFLSYLILFLANKKPFIHLSPPDFQVWIDNIIVYLSTFSWWWRQNHYRTGTNTWCGWWPVLSLYNMHRMSLNEMQYNIVRFEAYLLVCCFHCRERTVWEKVRFEHSKKADVATVTSPIGHRLNFHLSHKWSYFKTRGCQSRDKYCCTKL